MNKTIFSIAALMCATMSVYAQTWGFNNEPEEDANATMYLVDTTSVNFSNLTGGNQIWNYAQIGGYPDNTRTLTVTNAETYQDIFPDATHLLTIPGFMTTAYNYEANNDKIAHGYEFDIDGLGIVQFIFDDRQKMLQFPMNFETSFEDNLSGSFMLFDEPNDAVGFTWVTADGSGTLMLANGVSHSDVLRIHTQDTIYAEILLSGIPIPTSATIIRQQYDYVKPGVSNFPLFIHATLTVLNPLIGQFGIGVVLSSENPTAFANTPENALADLKVFPNPSTGWIQLQLPNANESAQVTITNLAGSVFYENINYNNNENIDLNNQPAGVYLVTIQQKDKTSVNKIIKK